MDHLRARGYRVLACGHQPDGPGVDNADQFFQVDILDVDAVEGLARSEGVEFVYSVGSDMAMPTVAAVSQRLGLPYFHDLDTTELLHRKVQLRSFLNAHELSRVEFRVVRTADDVVDFPTYPAIVKPSDSQGQRGISIVNDELEALAAVGDALACSRSGEAVIEELLGGPEVSVHVFVVDGEVRFLLPSDRFVWEGPLTGIPSGHGLPSHFLSPTSSVETSRLIHDVVEALGIRTGPLYFQLKLTESGPRIIEIAPRLDGCHLWRLVRLHTGFDILDRCFGMLAGEPWVDVEPFDDDVDHVLWFYLSAPDVPFDPNQWSLAEGRLVYEEFQLDPGELPRDINGVIARVGYGIVEGT